MAGTPKTVSEAIMYEKPPRIDDPDEVPWPFPVEEAYEKTPPSVRYLDDAIKKRDYASAFGANKRDDDATARGRAHSVVSSDSEGEWEEVDALTDPSAVDDGINPVGAALVAAANEAGTRRARARVVEVIDLTQETDDEEEEESEEGPGECAVVLSSGSSSPEEVEEIRESRMEAEWFGIPSESSEDDEVSITTGSNALCALGASALGAASGAASPADVVDLCGVISSPGGSATGPARAGVGEEEDPAGLHVDDGQQSETTRIEGSPLRTVEPEEDNPDSESPVASVDTAVVGGAEDTAASTTDTNAPTTPTTGKRKAPTTNKRRRAKQTVTWNEATSATLPKYAEEMAQASSWKIINAVLDGESGKLKASRTLQNLLWLSDKGETGRVNILVDSKYLNWSRYETGVNLHSQ